MCGALLVTDGQTDACLNLMSNDFSIDERGWLRGLKSETCINRNRQRRERERHIQDVGGA